MFGLLSKTKDSNEVHTGRLMYEPISILKKKKGGLENKSVFYYSMFYWIRG